MPLSVSFSNSVNGGLHWWTFGDGTFSTNRLPAKDFTSPGTYTALLTLTDTKGTGARQCRCGGAYDLQLVGAEKIHRFRSEQHEHFRSGGGPGRRSHSNFLEFLMGLEPKTFNGSSNGLPPRHAERRFCRIHVPRFKYNLEKPLLTGDITDNISNWTNAGVHFGPLTLQTISTIDNGLTETRHATQLDAADEFAQPVSPAASFARALKARRASRAAYLC